MNGSSPFAAGNRNGVRRSLPGLKSNIWKGGSGRVKALLTADSYGDFERRGNICPPSLKRLRVDGDVQSRCRRWNRLNVSAQKPGPA